MELRTVADPGNFPLKASPVTATTPEIRWHYGPTGLNEAILSLDYLPNHDSGDKKSLVLATGGADKEIKIWRIDVSKLQEPLGLEFVFSLSGHDRSINCVRFSPNGVYLAAASDDSTITVWTKSKAASENWSWDAITSFSDVSRVILACGHKGDITDLSWSPDSVFLSSSSVDNCSVIWNVEKGEVEERRRDHSQYVQGIAWDPLGEYLATAGNDRTCRVYALNGFDTNSRQAMNKKGRKCTNMVTIKYLDSPQEKKITEIQGTEKESPSSVDTVEVQNNSTKRRMYLDDTCPVFARRLSWTPDGSYLLTPTGIFRPSDNSNPVNTVYGFARGNLSSPAFHLPGHEKASLGIRCNPLLYELRTTRNGAPNFFQIPYRSILAVITLNAVIVYDSQQSHPLCTIKNLHYADLTDATWSSDGQTLSVSSVDGYVSFIQFEENFFGTSISNGDRIKMNHNKSAMMFPKPKLANKRKAKSPTRPQRVSMALVVETKSDVAKVSEPGELNAGMNLASVNTVQVRKKRKITAPVQPDELKAPTTLIDKNQEVDSVHLDKSTH